MPSIIPCAGNWARVALRFKSSPLDRYTLRRGTCVRGRTRVLRPGRQGDPRSGPWRNTCGKGFFSIALVTSIFAGEALAEAAIDALVAPAVDVAVQAPAEAGPEAAADEALAWDQFDDSTFDSARTLQATDESDDSLGEAPAQDIDEIAAGVVLEADGGAAPTTVSGVVLGPVGVDDQGRKGRLHTVAKGDTLWDLSAAYLGTPWVWPSVWIDNDDIANPHLILPGDKIWITAEEMRVVTDVEAEAFLEAPVAVAKRVVDEILPDAGARRRGPARRCEEPVEDEASDLHGSRSRFRRRRRSPRQAA